MNAETSRISAQNALNNAFITITSMPLYSIKKFHMKLYRKKFEKVLSNEFRCAILVVARLPKIMRFGIV